MAPGFNSRLPEGPAIRSFHLLGPLKLDQREHQKVEKRVGVEQPRLRFFKWQTGNPQYGFDIPRGYQLKKDGLPPT